MEHPPWVRAVLGYSLAAILLGPWRHSPPAAPGRDPSAPGLDPGRMTSRDLRRLPGVGQVLAQAIDRARRGHDPETGPLAWQDVHGIGPATEGKIVEWFHRRGKEAPVILPGSAPR